MIYIGLCKTFQIKHLSFQNENEAEDSFTQDLPSKPSPIKDKDSKRIYHNTSDHDYVEMAVKEKDGVSGNSEINAPKNVEADVFEFDEMKEGYDKIDSKLSYSKSNAHRMALKKEPSTEGTNQKKNETLVNSPSKTAEVKSCVRDSDLSPVKGGQSLAREEIKETLQKEKEMEEPEIDRNVIEETKTDEENTESKKSYRTSVDSYEKDEVPKGSSSAEEDSGINKGGENEKFDGDSGEHSLEHPNSDLEESSHTRRKSEDVGEQSEEEKPEVEDSETNKDEEVISNMVDINVSSIESIFNCIFIYLL